MRKEIESVKSFLVNGTFSKQELSEIRAAFELACMKVGEGNLSTQERKEIITNTPQNALILYTCLSKTFLERIAQKLPSLPALQKLNKPAYEEVLECAERVEEFCEKALGRKSSRLEFSGVCGLYARLVFDWFEEWKTPLTIRTVCEAFDAFPSMVNQAFPKYIENRLFQVILTQKL